MAPIRPRNRKPHRSSTTPLTPHPPSSNPTITNAINPHTHAPAKILKRRTKHSELLSRLHASHAPNESGPAKRRAERRKKKEKTPLTTSLAGLEDALLDAEGEWQGFQDGAGVQVGERRMKSLQTRRGSMKKREKAMVGERERFVRNLGVLVQGGGRGGEGEGVGGESGGTVGSSGRWKAIRRFIEGSGEG